jgi:hypothetical protein
MESSASGGNESGDFFLTEDRWVRFLLFGRTV